MNDELQNVIELAATYNVHNKCIHCTVSRTSKKLILMNRKTRNIFTTTQTTSRMMWRLSFWVVILARSLKTKYCWTLIGNSNGMLKCGLVAMLLFRYVCIFTTSIPIPFDGFCDQFALPVAILAIAIIFHANILSSSSSNNVRLLASRMPIMAE